MHSDMFFGFTWPINSADSVLGLQYSPHTEITFIDNQGVEANYTKKVITIGVLLLRIDIIL